MNESINLLGLILISIWIGWGCYEAGKEKRA